MAMRNTEELGLRNRLYTDYLFTIHNLTLNATEWKTLKVWSFCQDTGTFVHRLQADVLTSTKFCRLYHLVVTRTFYNSTFGELSDEELEKISADGTSSTLNSQADTSMHVTLPTSSSSTLQANTLTATLNAVPANATYAGSTSVNGPMPTSDVTTFVGTSIPQHPLSTSSDVQMVTLDQWAGFTTLKRVYYTPFGDRLHLLPTCHGLRKATSEPINTTLEEAKSLTRPLCQLCAQVPKARTLLCMSPGCNFENTFMPHFCCKKCRDGLINLQGHGRLCEKKLYME